MIQVLCKKDIQTSVIRDKGYFKKGEFYTLYDCDKWVLMVDGWCFNFRDNYSEHFYTPQEMRALKLKRLYEKNNG